MSASAVTLKYLLLAEDHLSKSLKGAGSEIDQTGKKASGMSTKLKVGLAAAAGAAVGFANASINKFKQVTVESRGLQRALGGTLEDASRWREAAILAGVDAGTFTKSAQKLDKTLVGAAKSTKTSAAMAKTLGFNFLDAHGKVKPMGELLPKISDRFASMPDGAEKTALAMQLFGKAGNSMLPMLSKGSSGLSDLMKQSDKFGTTLNDGAIDALSKSREQSRKFTAAMDGLKVQIGAQLLPVMNMLIGFIQSYVLPTIQKVTGFFKDHTTVLKIAVAAVGALIAILGVYKAAMIASSVATKVAAVAQGAMTAAQWLLNTAMAANPLALVVIALVALAAGFVYAYKHSETFRKIVQGAFRVVKAVAVDIANFFTKDIPHAFMAVVHGLHAAWDVVWPFLKKWGPLALTALAPFIGIPLLIWQHFSKIKDFIGNIVGWISHMPGKIARAASGMWDGIKDAFRAAIDWIIGGWNSIQFTIPKIHIGMPGPIPDINFGGWTIGLPDIPMLAKGGPVRAGMPYIVGDGGRPELFVPGQDGHVLPSVPHGSSPRGSVQTINLNVTVRGGLMTQAEVGRAVGKALEYATNSGTKLRIKTAVI